MSTYFASGSNRPGEIRGFSEIRHAVGVAAPEVMNSSAATRELEACESPVFLDSGAFSEVDFDENGPFVIEGEEISDSDWRARLLYAENLAGVLGQNLYVVAPDQVGFENETLGRLSRYRREVRRIADTGARVLVALQGIDKADFWRKVRLLDLAPADGLVAAMPCKKNATSPAEVLDFARSVRPRAIHLLGLGSTNKLAPALVSELEEMGIEVSLDSNLIRANVGRGKNPRKLTRKLDAVADELSFFSWREAPVGSMGIPVDYTDAIAEPSGWITPKGVQIFAELAVLDAAETKAFRKDPDGWLQADDRYLDPMVDLALDAAWSYFHRIVSTPERKRRAIRGTFAG